MTLIMKEIEDTPDAIAATTAGSRDEADEAASALKRSGSDRVFVVGNGSSYYVAMAGAYVSRDLTRGTSPLVIPMTAGEFAASEKTLRPSDAIIAVSASGEYRGVVDAFDRHPSLLRIAITQDSNSSLAASGDFVVLGRGGTQNVPVSTKTVATTFVALSLILLRMHDATSAQSADLEATAERCADAIRNSEAAVQGIVESLDGCQHAFVFGSGSGFAASLEGALKLKEMAGLHAEAAESTEMATGPVTMVDRSTRCISLTAAANDPSMAVASQVPSWGATLTEIGARASSEAGQSISVPFPNSPSFAFPSLAVPLWMIALALADKRGMSPEHPAWRERYAQQGLNHVLGE
ncbi:MAG: SIS domain-containing protein [Actinomycetia bacterium]|nr:SIS domain-containing protein [Actinomycetes bacterium]